MKLHTSKILMLWRHDMAQQRKNHTNYLITGAFTVLILLMVFGGINLMIQEIAWLENVKFQGLFECFIT